MNNDKYKTVRISKDSFEKLREIKFRTNQSYIDILKICINQAYENMKKGELKNDTR